MYLLSRYVKVCNLFFQSDIFFSSCIAVGAFKNRNWENTYFRWWSFVYWQLINAFLRVEIAFKSFKKPKNVLSNNVLFV